MAIIGSILHGAYGDYYEQLLCLKDYARKHPGDALVLFFESEARLRELRVFDLSFAREVHLAAAIGEVPIDRYVQYQVRDEELRESVLLPKAAHLRGKMDLQTNHKPWSTMRKMDLKDPGADVGLSELGRERLPQCIRDNGIDADELGKRFTVGFLWRYRSPGANAAVSARMMPSEDEVRRTKSELFDELIRRFDARVLVCGMNVVVTDENRARVDAKLTPNTLDVASPSLTYLKGLSWGLELEILRQASLCIVMPSGFSEALWIKRAGPTCLVDAPPHYLAKLVYNRMPLFGVLRPRELAFQLRQPHTKQRVMRHLKAKKLLPAS